MKKYIVPAIKAMNLELENLIADSMGANKNVTTPVNNGGWTREDIWNDSHWSEDKE